VLFTAGQRSEMSSLLSKSTLLTATAIGLFALVISSRKSRSPQQPAEQKVTAAGEVPQALLSVDAMRGLSLSARLDALSGNSNVVFSSGFLAKWTRFVELGDFVVVADFDKTLTRHMSAMGAVAFTAYGSVALLFYRCVLIVNVALAPCHGSVVEKSPFVSEEYRTSARTLFATYYPFEIDVTLSTAEKETKMSEWWTASNKLMIDHAVTREARRFSSTLSFDCARACRLWTSPSPAP
jgi:hypothetical protein